VIAFGTAVTDGAAYATMALPGIERAAEADSLVLTREGHGSIQRACNELLEEAAERSDLEALILLHQDLELRDDTLLARLRPLLADPRVGLLGLAGGRGLRSLAWWESDLYGAAYVPAQSTRFSRGSFEVDVVDGVLLVLAPWAVRMLRFDEAFAADFHGYDVDIALQVRSVGGRVIATDVEYFHHWLKDPAEDRASWVRNAVRLQRKWDRGLWPAAWSGAA
jgi:hypothetical protein